MRLRSFEIANFRTFKRLAIKRLGRVNLIVGKNNSGKTTVLEALRLYLSDDNWSRCAELLLSRDEYEFRSKRPRTQLSSLSIAPPLAFESLFHGRPNLEERPAFEIGPVDRKLKVRFSWLRRVEDAADSSVRYLAATEENEPEFDPDVVPGLEFDLDSRVLIPLDRLERFARRRTSAPQDTKVAYLTSAGMSGQELGRAWDAVALTEDEEIVVSALRLVVPTLEKIVLVQTPDRPNADRTMMAKLSEFPTSVPFKSLGEGAFHILGICLGMIKAREGALLIDEVENGIHYSIEPDLWRLIATQAELWNVQVFATTHSWDCVKGFHEGSAVAGLSNARLFRLERIEDRTRAIEFDSQEIAIAEQESIEVR